MSENRKRKCILYGAIYAVTLLAGVGCTLLLVASFSVRFVVSLLFVAFAYTAMFAMIGLCILDDLQNRMQNFALVLIGGIYFVAAVVVSLLLNLLKVSVRVFWAGEILVMAFGAVWFFYGFVGKLHIEKE